MDRMKRARLEQWYFGPYRNMCGIIYEDELERWDDGTPIYTSTIVKLDRENGILETRNTIYMLGEEYKSD